MQFKLLCPKCHSTDYSIERDRRIRTLSDPAAGLIFSCRCGKQMFGPNVEEEYKKQFRIWEAEQTSKSRGGKSQRPEPLNREEERRHAEVAHGADDDLDEDDDDLDDDEGDDNGHGHAHEDSSEEASTTVSAEGESCQWHGCNKIVRAGSKYCSRACSNKNARSRYKQRKGGEREAA